MSELDLLADCLKDTTKERDDLAAALKQATTEIAASVEVRKSLVRSIGMRDMRIEQLEGKLERCIWGGRPQPARESGK